MGPMPLPRNGQRVTEVNSGEARRSFAEMLNRVLYAGERFAVKRNGQVVALLVPVEPAQGAAVSPEVAA